VSRPFRRQDFDAPAFYAALNKIRNLRDFTWRQVSAASGVSTTTLSRMADGRHPDAASLAALSHWGGMNPANFMTDPSKPPYDNSLTAIVARLRASIAWLRDGKPTENGGIGLGDMIDMLPIIEAALTPSPTPTAPQEADALREALKLALKALEAIGDEMTVGERYTNAGQYLLDALEPARAALAQHQPQQGEQHE
jgi:transcriptional regulator with XRE-family HTH domain